MRGEEHQASSFGEAWQGVVQGGGGVVTRMYEGGGVVVDALKLLLGTITKLCKYLCPTALNPLFNPQYMGSGLEVFVQIGFGFEGKFARFTRIRSFICMSSDVLLQNTRFGTDHMTKGTNIGLLSVSPQTNHAAHTVFERRNAFKVRFDWRNAFKCSSRGR